MRIRRARGVSIGLVSLNLKSNLPKPNELFKSNLVQLSTDYQAAHQLKMKIIRKLK